MNKAASSSIIFFSLFLLFFSVKAEDPSYRKIIINIGDSTMHFAICPSSMEIKTKDQQLYHWYADNRIHKNKGNYSGRLIHGEVKTYDESGNLVELGEMKYGLKKGKWVEWHPNGEVKKVTRWKNGMKKGIQCHFDKEGTIVMKSRYRKDEKTGEDIIYNNGKKLKIEKVKPPKKEKGEKQLKVEKFNKQEKQKESMKDKENREKYQWFKDLFKKKENNGKIS